MFEYLKRMFFGSPEKENKPFNLYQYKFLRYREERNKLYPLPLSKVRVPFVKDMISVILPVYNGEKLIAESIESVLCQTYTNFEFIIVNDGSKDNTLSIAREYEKKDSRIRVIDKPNEKLPKTLSRGFVEAKGEFLTWTSDDNVMDRDFLEKMVNDLKSKPDAAMVYANMRLINKDGKKLRNHGWFEFPMGSSNVIFPTNAFELNTYANNTIGAAFMYRKAAKEVLGCYSGYKHTLEDYDYWMRMNSLFGIVHTDFKEPVYSYRWHDSSLTAKDNELGITKNRYKLMVLDDFRRDFYLQPLLWYIKSDSENMAASENFKKELFARGHIILEKDDIQKLYFGGAPSNICYASFGGVESDVFLPADSIKVCINGKGEESDKYFDIFAFDTIKEDLENAYSFENTEVMISYLDAKIKNDVLYSLEGRIETEPKYNKKLSVVLSTYKKTDVLCECMEALANQTADKNSYEIMFVNNDFKNEELKELVLDYSKKYEDINISYLTAPVKGLSHARNCGMWAASGEYILYIDDDAVADERLIEETISAFENNPDMGVIGGQVKLKVPEEAKDIVTKETISLWSNFEIEGDAVREAADYGEFPYGANYAARRSCLWQIGGFRCAYGRIGSNFGGGEETLVSFMMGEIGKKVGINPLAIVKHKVAADRFNLLHIEKTAYAGVLTQYNLRRDLYAPADWNDNSVRERAQASEKKTERLEKGSAEYVLHMALAKAYRDVYLNRQKDYEYLVKKGRVEEK